MATKTQRTAVEERMCNLTLTRAEWSVLVSLLDRNRTPIAAQSKASILAYLRDNPDVASLSIDRTCEKWATVLNLVWNDATKRAETRRVTTAITRQISASEFTRD